MKAPRAQSVYLQEAPGLGLGLLPAQPGEGRWVSLELTAHEDGSITALAVPSTNPAPLDTAVEQPHTWQGRIHELPLWIREWVQRVAL